jgi:hypothetical protein
MKIGIHHTLKYARSKNGIISQSELLDELYEIATPSDLVFVNRDVEVILERLNKHGLCLFHKPTRSSKRKDGIQCLFPLYMSLPSRNVAVVNDNNETIGQKHREELNEDNLTFEKLNDFYAWIEDDETVCNDDLTTHHFGVYDFLTNTILSAIIAQVYELFQDDEHGFKPVSDANILKDEPYRSWCPMSADNAFFLVESLNGEHKARISMSRTLHIDARLHVFTHWCGNRDDNSTYEQRRTVLLSAVAVVMTAARNVYSKFSGHKVHINCCWYADILLNGRRANIPLDLIINLGEVGYEKTNVYLATLKQNVRISELKRDYCSEEIMKLLK